MAIIDVDITSLVSSWRRYGVGKGLGWGGFGEV